MFVSFNYYTICLLVGGFVAFISGLVVFLNDKSKAENQAWFALTVSTSVWSFAYFYMTVAPDKVSGFLANWILHDAAIFIPLFYFLLVLIITGTLTKYRFALGFFSLCAIFFVAINTSTIFVSDVSPKIGFNFAPVPGPFYVYYFLFFSLVVLSGIIVAAIAASKTTDLVQKNRFKYTIYFASIAAVGGGSVFATTFFPEIRPYPLVLFSLYPAVSGYAILRYQLFDVKIITTEILTFALWLTIMVRMLFAESTREQFANGILFAFAIVLGVFLIRSVKREVGQREKIQNLANDLSLANDRLRELDQQKSEFVSLASHQLRGPLTAVKGYTSMLLDGDFGAITAEVKDALEKIFESVQDLTVVVGDYLDVSRIEQGRMQYDFTNFNLRDLVATVVTELKPNIARAKLNMEFNYDSKGSYQINADQGKIKQVIGNLIDNAIKYTPQGGLHVWLSHPDAISDGQNTHIGQDISNTSSVSVSNKVLLSISDTGVGIHPDVLPRLFEKFTRAPDASKTNIMGTGLGLYVAKKIMEAHHARIWAESPGPGKGSTFFIEFDELNAGSPVATNTSVVN